DSDISIQYDTYRSEFVHLRFRAGTRDARFFHFEKSLRLQVHEYITSGGHAEGGISVDYLEYGLPIDACPDLNLGVQNLQAILQSYAASIGREPDRTPPNDEFVVDGVSYNLRARIGRSLAARLSVDENGDRSLFDAARAIMVGIQQCS